MEFRTNFTTSFVLISLVCSITLVSAQEGTAEKKETVETSAALSFPYIGQITGDAVHMRAGRGTQYYSCGKLYTGTKVKVITAQFTWSRIVPPEGTFSWISSKYVRPDVSNPKIGIVTGDSVRVYAGSADGNPIHSQSVQLKLDAGEKVKLLGEVKDGYYKITPPNGAYLWISSEYIKPVTLKDKKPEAKPVTNKVPAVVEPKEKPVAERPVVKDIPVKSDRLREYQALEKQVDAERAKDLSRQNYAKIKASLEKIANDKSAGKAARYADYMLQRIKRFELAVAVDKEFRLQNKQLEQVKNGIENARNSRLAAVEDMGRFSVVGTFDVSKVYGTEKPVRHYTISNETGKIICYALPSGAAENIDLNKFKGCRVGLTGTIKPYPAVAGALVRFTEIVKLK